MLDEPRNRLFKSRIVSDDHQPLGRLPLAQQLDDLPARRFIEVVEISFHTGGEPWLQQSPCLLSPHSGGDEDSHRVCDECRQSLPKAWNLEMATITQWS